MRRYLPFCLSIALAFAGCRSSRPVDHARAPDWESPESIAAAEALKAHSQHSPIPQPGMAPSNVAPVVTSASDTSHFGHKRTMPVIVIDPGHGGSDPGTHSAEGPNLEKDLTLDWARRVQSILASKGFQVFSTRTNDMDVSLPARVAFAESHSADVFVSLHFNSSAEGRQQGIETYCFTPVGLKSTMNRGYEDDPAIAYPNNAFDTSNIALACQVHAALVRNSGSNDRGVRRARFPAVLKNQNRPAVLIEGGYISSPEEAARIGTPEYRQTLAVSVAEALVAFLKVPDSSGREQVDAGPNRLRADLDTPSTELGAAHASAASATNNSAIP